MKTKKLNENITMYKLILKPFLFFFNPETAHNITMKMMSFVLVLPFSKYLFSKLYQVNHSSLERKLFGLRFPNPVGLAAGFDKDGKYWNKMKHLGFGFIEIGTVTPKPQDGNEKPRLFRLVADDALINRMGFNNEGVNVLIERLKNELSEKGNLIIGGNIGKNKITPNEAAWQDYEFCFNSLFNYVDYFVVNVSSPNTPGLRELQEKEPLMQLLNHLQQLNSMKNPPKPILLKIAPDLTDQQLDDIIDIVAKTKIAGVISTNTTIDRSGLLTETQPIGAGGLSGKPLTKRSTEVIRYLHQKSNGAFPIIGVGGIHNEKDALEKLEAGASLIQLYTGLVFEGPGLVKKINQALIKASTSARS